MKLFEKLKRFLTLVTRVVSKYFTLTLSSLLRIPQQIAEDRAVPANDGKQKHLLNQVLKVKESKSFWEIPGPFHLPIVGSQWLYYWFGPYSLDKLHLANEDKFKVYGPIVKEHYLWNFPIIHLYDKKDIEEVLKYPSKFPIRPGLEAQCTYRRSRPERYSSVGLVNVQGLEWHNLRSKLITQLTSPSLGEYTVEQVCSISEEFIEKLRNDRDAGNVVENFEKTIYSCGLEVIFSILLGQRLGALKSSIPPVAERLMVATENLFEVSHEAMYGLPWWKYFPTSSYRKLAECEETIYNIFADLVNQALESQIADTNSSVLNHILAADGVDKRDKIVALIDLVAGGIETTGNASLFLLNNILKDPKVKSKVYEELDRVLSPGTPLTLQLILELKYLRACIAESLRITPVAPNVARILEKPFVLQGYDVPAGTLVVCETWVASLQECNYPMAECFIPERWLAPKANFHPFLTVPFGAGRRMCPGKRIAEHEMLIIAAKLLLNFDISFDGPLQQVYKFLMSPKGPIKVILQDRQTSSSVDYNL